LIASTEWNGIFVDSKYFPLFGIADNSIWQMNQNYQFWTHVFQLYDGTVIVGRAVSRIGKQMKKLNCIDV
jgi:hypothetical protein